MKRYKILISAYACQPGMGSEPGVGWNVVQAISQYCDVWVLTRSENRTKIEEAILEQPSKNLTFIYCDPPAFGKYLPSAQVPHYYLWQIGAYLVAKDLLSRVDIDLIHHVTYVRYSTPSFLSLLRVPFVWGPVGGGESAPKAFFKDFSLRSKTYELARFFVHKVGEIDLFLHKTIEHSVVIRATTIDTAQCLYRLGAKDVEIVTESGLSNSEITHLSKLEIPNTNAFRFISIGRLLHWKGFHLGLKAFALANLPEAEYWICGEGPERESLQNLAIELKVAHKVKFLGKLPRNQVLEKLSESHILVHPSLHDSGGWVCLEAMAAGRPVICLNLGGPSTQVTDKTGFKISALSPNQVIEEMAQSMIEIASDRVLLMHMSKESKELVRTTYSWETKALELSRMYEKVINYL